MIRGGLVLVLALALAACGLRPLYSGGSQDAAARDLAAIQVPEIPGRAGWLVRNAITDQIAASGKAAPRYRLDIRLDDSLEALGVLNDDTISRERRVLRARYQLIDLQSDTILLDASAGSDAGIDVVSSEYATIAAEQRALENLAREIADQIVTQSVLALRSAAGASRQPPAGQPLREGQSLPEQPLPEQSLPGQQPPNQQPEGTP